MICKVYVTHKLDMRRLEAVTEKNLSTENVIFFMFRKILGE